jgi:protein O-mannosyl-transferase
MSRARKQRRAAAREAGAAVTPPSPWLQRAPLVAGLVAFLVYLPSLGGGFLYDDQAVIVMNPSIHSLADIRAVLLYEPSRPLLNITWAVNYAVGGLDHPWQYHLVNVLIHAGNAALLASLLHWMALRLGRSDARPIALAGACLFAASPMAAETVAYITSRSSALVTLFALATLRTMASVMAGGPKRRVAAALGLFLLALATKEEAAAVPLLLVLVDYFFVADRRWADLRGRWALHAPFLALLPLGLAARRVMTGAWLPAPAIDPAIYILTQWAAFPAYFLRAVIPLDPALYRYHAPATWPPGPLVILGTIASVALFAWAWRIRRVKPEWSFAVAALAVGLLPSSSVVALQEMVVDHRAYLGSFGVAFALGALLWERGRWPLVAATIAVLSARSVHYQWVLADPVRAWEDAVRRAPGSGDAQCALGEAYAARKDPRAEAAFKKAIGLDPRIARYWANLGVYYSEVGRIAEAAEALRGAVRANPQDAAIRNYLGLMLQSLGRTDEAIAELEAAIAAEPQFSEAKIKLAALMIGRGQHERARVLLDDAIKAGIDPQQAEEIGRLQGQLP